MVNGVVLTLLAVECVSDIKSKSISLLRQLVFFVIAIALNILFSYQSIGSVMGGMAIGGALFLFSYVTKEGVGYGDCLIFLVIGTYVGFIKNMELLFVSLVLSAIVGIAISLWKKKSLNMQIPFVPFILAGYLILTIFEIKAGGGI